MSLSIFMKLGVISGFSFDMQVVIGLLKSDISAHLVTNCFVMYRSNFFYPFAETIHSRSVPVILTNVRKHLLAVLNSENSPVIRPTSMDLNMVLCVDPVIRILLPGARLPNPKLTVFTFSY